MSMYLYKLKLKFNSHAKSNWSIFDVFPTYKYKQTQPFHGFEYILLPIAPAFLNVMFSLHPWNNAVLF